MAVPESKRGTGKFDVLIKANDLTVYTIRITKNPKNFAPEYQTALTDDIIRTAKDIYVKCWTANNIKVGEDAEKWKRGNDCRKRRQGIATIYLRLCRSQKRYSIWKHGA